jgi:hypothetical protein
MTSGITYYSVFPEDENLGAVINSFLFRWISSCIAKPEYEPEDVLKAVLHALDSFECTEAPFMVVMILPAWIDTPWNSTAVRDHGNQPTLIHIPAGHMRFVPANNQSDGATCDLSPAKWPVEIFLIANVKGREVFLSHDRIQTILALAIQATSPDPHTVGVEGVKQFASIWDVVNRELRESVARCYVNEVALAALCRGMYEDAVLDRLGGQTGLLPSQDREAFRHFFNHLWGSQNFHVICHCKKAPPLPSRVCSYFR